MMSLSKNLKKHRRSEMNGGAFFIPTLAHGAVLCHPFHGFVGKFWG